MKTQTQIIKEAKLSYESHFEDAAEVADDAYRGHDVILDKDQLENKVQTMKAEKAKQHDSLEVLRKKLIVEAEDSLNKTFGEEPIEKPHKRMNTTEMQKEFNKEKEHLTQMVNTLKTEKLSQMNH